MSNTKEIKDLKKEIYELALSYEDVLAFYKNTSENSAYYNWKLAKKEEFAEAIEIGFVNKTQLAVKLNMKVSISANVPVLYSKLQDGISKLLSEHKINLKELRMSIIAAN